MQLSRKNQILLDTIARLLRRNATTTLKRVIKKLHPADIALIMDHLRSSEAKVVFNCLEEDKERAAEVLSEVSYSTAAELLETLDPQHIADILTEMASDDAAGIIADMPDELTDQVLKLMEDKDSDLVEELLSYSEETAGRIMTPDFLALQGDVFVEDAIREVQKASDAEMVFYVYVVDQDKHLLGVISLRQLLTVSPKKLLKEIMVTDVVRVRTEQDQEEVARLVARYNLLAIPVVTDRNKLVGIVTVDDILDVITEEAAEDIKRMSGASTEDIESSTVIEAAKSRFLWLLISLIGGLAAYYILVRFKPVVTSIFAIVACIPLVLGLGGHIANQSATLVAQGIVSGVISLLKIRTIILRELKIDLILSLLYGLLMCGAMFLISGFQLEFALLMGIIFIIIMLLCSLLGAMFPILFHRINIDPALASGPISTALIAVISITLYLMLLSLFY
ncbi:magnesium transporter [bacterium]|nr:magnesium transporter [bacterium]